MTTYALIVAAGRGARLDGGRPKQYLPLGGVPVLRHSLARFAAHDGVDAVRAVIHGDDRPLYDEAAADLPVLDPVIGGATRQESVRLGLESVMETADAPAHDRVLVHDAARPFVSADLIGRVIDALVTAPAVVPVVNVADTLKRAENGWVTETVSRDGLYRVQTPQGFHLAPLMAAHRASGDESATDDTVLMERAGHPVATVAGQESNFKITTSGDMERAAAMMEGAMETRVGQGYDVHRFGTGDHIMLCGVRIPHDHGLDGHSDADAGAHAVTDAILGAMGGGDIGQLFPSDDPTWQGAPSAVFLEVARNKLAARGGQIVHIDVTLVCETPKISPYRAAMIVALAEMLEIAPERVSIKATTTDGLGFTGRREGVAAQAVATIALPTGLA